MPVQALDNPDDYDVQPVDGDPFAAPTDSPDNYDVTPVDHNPFAGAEGPPQPISQLGGQQPGGIGSDARFPLFAPTDGPLHDRPTPPSLTPWQAPQSPPGAPSFDFGDYKARVAALESTAGRTSANRYQFQGPVWRQYGRGNINDPAAQEAAMNRLTQANYAGLTRSLGRAPTPSELYLAHQQGLNGALALLRSPLRRSGAIVGNAAIRGNAGNPRLPASSFVNLWARRYALAAPKARTASIPGSLWAGADEPVVGMQAGGSVADKYITRSGQRVAQPSRPTSSASSLADRYISSTGGAGAGLQAPPTWAEMNPDLYPAPSAAPAPVHAPASGGEYSRATSQYISRSGGDPDAARARLLQSYPNGPPEGDMGTWNTLFRELAPDHPSMQPMPMTAPQAVTEPPTGLMGEEESMQRGREGLGGISSGIGEWTGGRVGYQGGGTVRVYHAFAPGGAPMPGEPRFVSSRPENYSEGGRKGVVYADVPVERLPLSVQDSWETNGIIPNHVHDPQATGAEWRPMTAPQVADRPASGFMGQEEALQQSREGLAGQGTGIGEWTGGRVGFDDGGSVGDMPVSPNIETRSNWWQASGYWPAPTFGQTVERGEPNPTGWWIPKSVLPPDWGLPGKPLSEEERETAWRRGMIYPNPKQPPHSTTPGTPWWVRPIPQSAYQTLSPTPGGPAPAPGETYIPAHGANWQRPLEDQWPDVPEDQAPGSWPPKSPEWVERAPGLLSEDAGDYSSVPLRDSTRKTAVEQPAEQQNDPGAPGWWGLKHGGRAGGEALRSHLAFLKRPR